MPTQKNIRPQAISGDVDFPKIERELLEKWYQNGTVSKYLTKNNHSPKKFSFLDGPITANNPMGVHHAWGRTYKDLWQRFNNMRGYQQRFQNGFDCQGLWVEVEVEKELGFKTKKDIETYGVAEFIQQCKDRVKKYSEIQTNQSKRLGYFMDWDHSYFTLSDENNYTIWKFLRVCHEKNWIYKGEDAVPWCPRCETAISQHEILTEDYKQITHQSIYFKLPIVGKENEYLLVWTTTPWTIPGNVAVAVDPHVSYSLVTSSKGDSLWIAKDLVETVLGADYQSTIKTVSGQDLVGYKYVSPFADLEIVGEAIAKSELTHTVIATDPLILPIGVTEGTGLVHIATGCGTEDHALGKKYNLPNIRLIADNADYLPNLGPLSNLNAKKHPEVIFEYLNQKDNRWVFKIQNYTHKYPACWRCKTELVWKLAEEWYISMDKTDPADKKKRTLRQKMMDVAKTINWKPEFGKERELDWLKNMHDWLISKKNRYWGLALPIWECPQCHSFEVIGSKEELKQKSTAGWSEFDGHSPHKPYIDLVKIKCRCGHDMVRIQDVGNPWLDAGVVAFSTLVDPETQKVSYLDDKKYWEQWFPADFITESFPGQFKNWFYSLIAMSTVFEDKAPFQNVLGFASLLAEDGRPMHKSWGNSIEFNEAADKIGVDVIRWTYLRHNPERDLCFGYKVADDIRRRFYMILWNCYKFYVNNASLENISLTSEFESPPSILDEWILTRLDQMVIVVTTNLEKYDPTTASESIDSFVQDLSLWYIRRSRDRVGPSTPGGLDKQNCYLTLNTVFNVLSRILMPFTPFIADLIYTNVTGEESVNLADWPEVSDTSILNEKLLQQMIYVRQVCEAGHSARKQQSIAVKQPLAKITISGDSELLNNNKDLIQLIKDELNIENVAWKKSNRLTVELDTAMTPDLLDKGKAREIIRQIQEERKKNGCRLDEYVNVTLPSWPVSQEQEIKRQALVSQLTKGETLCLTPK